MFFSSIAHELRTPLNCIIPMLHTLPSKLNKPTELLQYNKIILNSALHLQNVIEDALDMGRIENHRFQINNEPFDLRRALQDVREVMSFQIEQKRLWLRVEVDDKVPQTICGD